MIVMQLVEARAGFGPASEPRECSDLWPILHPSDTLEEGWTGSWHGEVHT